MAAVSEIAEEPRELGSTHRYRPAKEVEVPPALPLFTLSPLRDCGPNESARPDDRDDQGYCAKRVQEDFNGFGHIRLKRVSSSTAMLF
jgi:hypothetical protein